MRDNSGQGKSSNNNRNPTLKEHEREQGVSGQAIQGEQKAEGSDRKRTDSRTDANVSGKEAAEPWPRRLAVQSLKSQFSGWRR